MKLTTKGRYAVTALLDFAIHQEQGPITIAQVASRQQISTSYLERLASRMRSKGLLKSIRGAKGGYLLAKPAQQITIAEIITAVDEGIDTTRCQGKANCQQGKVCLTHQLWEQLNDNIYHFLQSVTLQSLVKSQHKTIPILMSDYEHA